MELGLRMQTNFRSYSAFCRFQGPRGLRRGFAVACLQGLRVSIPTGAWMSVCCECCVLSGSSLCGGPIPPPEDFHRVCHREWTGVVVTLYTYNH
jgi:hypothetical protein